MNFLVARATEPVRIDPALAGSPCHKTMMIGLQHYLILGAVMFVCGLLTILVKRNAIGILMGVELVLNAANVNLVAFNRYAMAAARPVRRA